MTFKRILSVLATVAAVGTALGAAGSVQASPLVWSVGLSQPGVAVTIGNAPVVVHQPMSQVTYYPVYTPVHAPVVVYPRPHVGGGHGKHRGWHHGWHRGHGHGHGYGHGHPGRGHDH